MLRRVVDHLQRNTLISWNTRCRVPYVDSNLSVHRQWLSGVQLPPSELGVQDIPVGCLCPTPLVLVMVGDEEGDICISAKHISVKPPPPDETEDASPSDCSKFNLGSQNDWRGCTSQPSVTHGRCDWTHLVPERQLILAEPHAPTQALSYTEPVVVELARELQTDATQARGALGMDAKT